MRNTHEPLDIPAFILQKPTKVHWKHKWLLRFVKRQTETRLTFHGEVTTIFKILKGKKYVIDEFVPPPTYYSCRCIIKKN